MGMRLGIRRETFSPPEDQRWLGSAFGTTTCESGTLDASAFLALWPDGVVPSGVLLAQLTATGLWVPYGVTDEVQTITEGGSGLTSFTLTFSGQTTGAIAAAATAATVQAALEALSNIAVGDVVVTGAAGGPYTVRFAGTLADENVAQMTATPTGGTGTVTIATTTAGGTEGTGGAETAGRILFTTTDLGGTTADTVVDTPVPLMWQGRIVVDKLPANSGINAAAVADLKHFHFVGEVAA